MKKLLLLLFFSSQIFTGQDISLDSVDYNPFVISENTLNYLTNNGYADYFFVSYSQAIYTDFNNDSNKDIIITLAGTPYKPTVIIVLLWDLDSNKFVENHNYLVIVEGEAALWDNTVGDFNGDGLNDLYVAVGNYHGEWGQQPDYYPINSSGNISSNMPGHLFLNNGSSFDSQFIDNAMHANGHPNYERGYVYDVDGDEIPDIIVPSVNQHPENVPANNFLASKYNVNSENQIIHDFIYQWENSFNTPDGFYISSHSVVIKEYNDKIYILYPGFEESSSNGPYWYPEVSIYSKEIDENGDFQLLDKFRLQRSESILNQDSFTNRETFYITDLDNDGNEEFMIMMYTLNATPHAGFHVFNHTGEEITEDWFIGDSYLGHSANGFYFEDFNNDGNIDILMVDVYTENYSETVFYLNNGEKFVMKTIELDPEGGWVFPVDINQDGIFEILKFDAQYSQETELTYTAYLNYLDYSDALTIEDFYFNKIYLFPNPSSDFIHINGIDKELEVTVNDILGKKVMRKFVKDKIDISTLEKGIYLFNITDGINTSTHKIIKE